MNRFRQLIKNKRGGIGTDVILWLLGVPLPIIILLSLMRGCR